MKHLVSLGNTDSEQHVLNISRLFLQTLCSAGKPLLSYAGVACKPWVDERVANQRWRQERDAASDTKQFNLSKDLPIMNYECRLLVPCRRCCDQGLLTG